VKFFRSEIIKQIDTYTIQHEPVSSLDLMERAAKACVEEITKRITQNVVVFAGPGNNGGDGLAVARLLADAEYRVEVFLLNISNGLSPDCACNVERLRHQGKVNIRNISSENDFPKLPKEAVVIDALFGTGLSRMLTGIPAALVNHINQSGCYVISIDIPSGLFGEDNTQNNPDSVVQASHTITLHMPKLAFLLPENFRYTSSFSIVDIGLHPVAIEQTVSSYFFTTISDAKNILKTRSKFSHKGSFGHALLIAGSFGKVGASVLASRACLRSGVGLLTVHTPACGYTVLQMAVPEAMLTIDDNAEFFSVIPDFSKFSALGIGPGIGTTTETQRAFLQTIETFKGPMVIDADGLNCLSFNPAWIKKLLPGTVLTPHPGEFERLVGKSANAYERLMKLQEFAVSNRLVVVLKGAHTVVALPNGELHFNSTGNPGMATAGSGDVLTGIILSLLAQGYGPEKAAILAVFLHGLAGDRAALKMSQEALVAGDIVSYLGEAFRFFHLK